MIRTIKMLAYIKTYEMVQYSPNWWMIAFQQRIDSNMEQGPLEDGLTPQEAVKLKIEMWCHDNCTDTFVASKNKVMFRSVEDATLFAMSTEKVKPDSVLAQGGTSAGGNASDILRHLAWRAKSGV